MRLKKNEKVKKAEEARQKIISTNLTPKYLTDKYLITLMKQLKRKGDLLILTHKDKILEQYSMQKNRTYVLPVTDVEAEKISVVEEESSSSNEDENHFLSDEV